MSQLQVVLQRAEDRRSESFETADSDYCTVCGRALRYDANRNFWRHDDIYGEPAMVSSVKGGEYVCGDRCKSQYIFNSSSENEQEDMRRMARMCEEWLGVEYSRRRWGFNSYSQLVSTADLLNQEMTSLMASFGMEDGQNPPAWYVTAVLGAAK